MAISPYAGGMSPKEIRRIILQQSKRANVGHIGSCLCVVEILTAIYRQLRAESPDDPDRDRFILSKGHAALALYAALAGIARRAIHAHVYFVAGSFRPGLSTLCALGLLSCLNGSMR